MYVCQRDGVKTESRHGTLTQILTPCFALEVM
jgi:hypothetical protein